MDESPQGDSGDGRVANYPLEEVLFFLLESGVSEQVVYGWHDGWHYDRLLRLFAYFKKRELQHQREAILAVSIGASSLFTSKVMKKFMTESEKALGFLEKRSAEDLSKSEKQADNVKELNKMFTSFGMQDA